MIIDVHRILYVREWLRSWEGGTIIEHAERVSLLVKLLRILRISHLLRCNNGLCSYSRQQRLLRTSGLIARAGQRRGPR